MCEVMLWIRRGNRNNLGIILLVFHTNRHCDFSLELSNGVIFNEGSQYMFSLRNMENNPCSLFLPYFFGYKTEFFLLPKQSQKSRSVLKDGSRSLGLFGKGKSCITATFHRTDLLFVVSLDRGTPSYSRINTVSGLTVDEC